MTYRGPPPADGWELAARRIGYLIYIAAVLPFAIFAGILISTGHIFYCYLLPMFQVATSRLDGLAPPARQLRLPARRDPALSQYFYGPAWIDLSYVWQLAVSNGRRESMEWQRRLERWTDRDSPEARRQVLPLAIGTGMGLVLGAPTGAATALVLIGVQVTVIGALALITRVVAGVLRATDSALLWLRHIRDMRCLACFERMPYPAYDCPGCDATHWDIRPGRFGVLRRVCSCGAPLPTLLLLGTVSLPTRCPFHQCGALLEHRPGELREEVLSIFGATGAGKTRMMYGLVAALQHLTRRPGVSVSLADRWTTEQLEDVWRYLRDDQQVSATAPVLQRGCALRVHSGRYQRLLQFFDAAGERFYSLERSSDLLYLGGGRTFVLVIDPLSVNEFWLSLSTPDRDRLRQWEPASMPQPRLVYEQTVDRITELNGKPHQSRLAVVFSRADILGDLGPTDRDEDAVRRWAEDRLGLGGLLRNARFDFKEVTLFSTAAVVKGNHVDDSITTLLQWILSTSVPSEGEQPPLVLETIMSDTETPLHQRTYRNIRALVFALTILGFCALVLLGVMFLL